MPPAPGHPLHPPPTATRFATRSTALCCGLLVAARLATAADLPLWEAGAGLAAISLPDYRGSDERRNYLLPLPYFIYRGEFVKADRDGVRGVLHAGRRFEIDLSAALSPPVNSSRNAARAGMEDLQPVGEIGPNIETTLWQRESVTFKLRAPLRTAFTLEGSPRNAGWVFSPRLDLALEDFAGSRWQAALRLGPIYASRRHHAYFYSVPAAVATPARPAYDAPGGYAGMQSMLTLSRRFQRLWVGAFLRHDTLAGAAFADSPLLRDRRYLAGGLGVAWILGESMRRVERTP